GADGSYGIQVAKLAGLPRSVTDRAKELLRELEEADISKKKSRRMKKVLEGQVEFFIPEDNEGKTAKEVLEELISVDISTLTPLDALNILYRLQLKARKG
ncbi:MAG: hypothetical protein WBL32_04790, partial [Acetivibrionales bacterium]